MRCNCCGRVLLGELLAQEYMVGLCAVSFGGGDAVQLLLCCVCGRGCGRGAAGVGVQGEGVCC
jgi:hypothetical protein